MNETDLDREPVELVEIITPKCANTYGVGPCTATGGIGFECFNRRNGCQAVNSFQARPLAHLTPDRILLEGETGTTDFNGETFYIIEVDLFIPLDPDGVVFNISTFISNGLYIGFSAGDLVVRAGNSSAARFAIDSLSYEGKSYSLIAVLNYDSGVNCTVTVYLFDPIELELTLLGSATSAGDPISLFLDTDYGVGTSTTTVPTGESVEDYNGAITNLRMYDAQSADLFPDQDAYRTRYWFDDGRKAKPADDLYIRPLLQNVSTVGSRLNLTGADDRYEPLGRRAFMEVNFTDAPDSDNFVDPYRLTRPYDPSKRGTFWKKWLAREKFGKTRALIRRYTGYRGQRIVDMRRQTYVVDRVSGGRGTFNIKARDVLALTEFSKVQIPAPTDGQLDADLTDAATTLVMAGDVTTQYTATGTLRINEELITYTSCSYDVTDDQTDFTGLTRGTDGSIAAEHDVGDNVQLCKRYTNVRVKDLLTEWLVTDAEIPAQLVDLDKIVTEDDENLASYNNLSTVLSVPTGVDRLIGELAESCSFYVWWNERSQLIDMQAIKPLTDVDATFTDSANIIGDTLSLEERPKERISTVSIYYSPRNFAGELDDPLNFKNQSIIASSAGNDLDQYAKLPQARTVFSRWLNNEATANQTGVRFINRYADVPIYTSLMLDAKDRQYWVGNFISLNTEELLTTEGLPDIRRWLIIEAEEVEAGHMQRVVLSDITLDGQIYVITPNDQGTYTAEAFAQRLAFITDNNGLNADGTEGATIA